MLLKLMRYLNRKKVVVEFGSLHTITPVSRVFGLDRGTPVNRYYIEKFLAVRAGLIHGRVLEIGGREYSRRFGGDRVERFEVLHATPDNPEATIVGDLTDPGCLPEGAFDCFLCTQTFDCIFELHKAVQGAHRLLKPGGVLLATMCGISQISRYDMERWATTGDSPRLRLRACSSRSLPAGSRSAASATFCRHCPAAGACDRGPARSSRARRE